MDIGPPSPERLPEDRPVEGTPPAEPGKYELRVELRRAATPATPDQQLWQVIRASSNPISFKDYNDSLDDLVSGDALGDSVERQDWEGKPAARSLLEEANARIRQSETFAWAVPGLAIAAEAFLLGATLRTTATPRQQAVASLAGIVILLAALHFLAKHTLNFRVYEAVIERSRKELGLPFVSMRQLVGSAGPDKKEKNEQARKDEQDRIEAIRNSFPAHVELVRQGWLEPKQGLHLVRRVRNRFARRWRSVRVWTFAILILIVLDIAILVQALTRIF